MSDEIKTPENAQPIQGSEEALNDELNNLKDIFQKEWQKTIEESEKESPVIQELDDTGEPEEEPEENSDDSSDNAADTEPRKKKKKKDKKGKKRSRAPLIVLIVLLIIIIIPLLSYFVCSVTVPNFNSIIASYSAALTAETDEKKIAAYEDVISLCKEGTMPGQFVQSLYEEVVVLKCKAEGYASALEYMQKNMTEDMITGAKSAEFKDFLKIGDSINAIAENAFSKTEEALKNAGSLSETDFNAAAQALGTPELIKKEVVSALTSIAEGMALEQAADTEEQFMEAISDYFSAASQFSTLGADTDAMYENIAVKVYNAGYLYETTYIIDQYFKEEQLSNPKTDAFVAVLGDIEALKASDIDIYAVTLACYENNTYSDDDLKNAINADLPDKLKLSLVNIGKSIIEGIERENEKNLTKASLSYSEAISTLEALELEATELAKRLIRVYVLNGDTQSANSLKETYITAEVLESSDDEFKTFIDELTKLYNAQYAVNEVFYPFYSEAYYYGKDLNKEEINAALDKLVTDEADEYLLAFVSYYRYLTEGFTDENTDIMLKYLTEFAEKMGKYPVLYGISLAEVYRMSGDYEKAEEIAKEILEINIADDYSNSILAFVYRINNNVDEALKTAEKGVQLSGESYYCAAEALVDLILKGDFEKAFDYAKALYEENLTVDNCEYIKIIAALYDGSNTEIKAELDSYNTEIDELFENYGLTLSDSAKGIIDKTLTPADVFLKAPYSLG
ncbi:MAG: hypothetical protein J1E34_01725 [Oscillospiraceae bacterium]|nr:hypothetical protein [Oscillospiraceae bacterium]